jgi:OOP family OmpA-OmpF porin
MMMKSPSLSIRKTAANRLRAMLCLSAGLVAPAALAQAPVQYQIENNELKLPAPIVFQTGSDKLSPESDPALEHVRGYLEAKSYISTLRIEVHSDRDGSAAASQALTEKRALSVAKWLTSHGVDCKRLLAVGFGGNKPIAENNTPENKAKNRRVTFVNAALRGRAIGGMPPEGGGRNAGDVCAR